MTRACSDCGKQISMSSRGKCWGCRYPSTRRQELLALHLLGMSYGAIAARVGMTKTAVHSAIRKERGEPVCHREPSPTSDADAARVGSRKLLEAYARYWRDHVEGRAA